MGCSPSKGISKCVVFGETNTKALIFTFLTLLSVEKRKGKVRVRVRVREY